MTQNGKKHALVIRTAQGADCGRFTIQAMNAAGIKQSTCMLIVAPAPTPIPGGSMSISWVFFVEIKLPDFNTDLCCKISQK